MKLLLTSLAAFAALVTAAPATAHDQPWYWPKAVAEQAVLANPNNQDIFDLDCVGLAPRRHLGRISVYKHFRCVLYGEGHHFIGIGTLHVVSRTHYRMTRTRAAPDAGVNQNS